MAQNEEVVGGAEEQPNESVSPTIDEKTIELLTRKLEGAFGEKFTNLEKNLLGQVSGLREVQGEIDKSQSTFRNEFAKYEALLKKGLEPDEAMSELERGNKSEQVLQDLEKKYNDLVARLEGSGKPDNATQEVVDAFSQFDLDLKDPRVVLEMQKSYKDKDQMEFAAFKLAKQIGQSPNPNPAQDPATPGGKGQTVDYNKLAEEYNELSRTPTAPGHMERMTEIQKDMQSLK